MMSKHLKPSIAVYDRPYSRTMDSEWIKHAEPNPGPIWNPKEWVNHNDLNPDLVKRTDRGPRSISDIVSMFPKTQSGNWTDYFRYMEKLASRGYATSILVKMIDARDLMGIDELGKMKFPFAELAEFSRGNNLQPVGYLLANMMVYDDMENMKDTFDCLRALVSNGALWRSEILCFYGEYITLESALKIECCFFKHIFEKELVEKVVMEILEEHDEITAHLA